MLGTQQFYNAQFNEQAAWQHGGQTHTMTHPQKVPHDVHYSRIAVNPSHSSARSTTDQTDITTNGTSLTSLTSQSTSNTNMEQLSEENQKMLAWVAELMDPARREGALMELSKKREQNPELALILWHSFGVMTSLLQEIISVYPLLNPSQLTAAASNRVCNALALLQCVASHNDTRGLFLNGMCGYTSWLISILIRSSAYSLVLVSLSQHHIEKSSFRVPSPHFLGRDWCAGQERAVDNYGNQRIRSGRHQFLSHDHLPSFHRDYPAVLADHGDRQ